MTLTGGKMMKSEKRGKKKQIRHAVKMMKLISVTHWHQ